MLKRPASSILLKLFVGGSGLAIINISYKLVNFILLPFLTFHLTSEDFGIIAIIITLVNILGVLYNPGIVSSATRNYYSCENDEEKNALIGSVSFFLIGFPWIITLILLFFGEALTNSVFSDFKFYPFGLIALFVAAITQLFRFWSIIKIARKQLKKLFLASLIKLSISFISTILLVLILDFGLYGRIFSIILPTLFLYIIALKDFSRYFKSYLSYKILLNNLIEGFPLLLSTLSYTILSMSDRIFIEKMLGISSVGVYDVAYTLATIPLFVSVGFDQIIKPLIFESLNENRVDETNEIITFYSFIIFIVTLFILLFIKEFANLLISNEFIEIVPIIPIILLGIHFQALANLFIVFPSFNKKFKVIGLVSFLISIINIVLNFLFIIYFGLKGAAYATTLTFLLLFSMYAYISLSQFKQINLFSTYATAIAIISFALILHFSESTLLNSPFITFIKGVIYGIVILLFLKRYLSILIPKLFTKYK